MASQRRLLVPCLALGAACALVVALHLSSASAGSGDPTTDARLPAMQERVEGRYDDDGCLRTGIDERDCSVTAEEIDDILAGDDVDDVRQLTGFSGTGWTDDVSAGRPVVLEDSIRTSDDGGQLVGLVRNETAEALDAIEITATLRDAAGQVIATVSDNAAVSGVRSGEPVPFSLAAPTLAGDVERLEWSAEPVEGAQEVSREFEWQPFWERPAGSRDPVVNPIYTETGSGPHPLVLFGSVTNLGPDSGPVEVTTAWFDADGGLVALVASDVVDTGGASLPELGSGDAGDVILVASGVPEGATSITWVVGS